MQAVKRPAVIHCDTIQQHPAGKCDRHVQQQAVRAHQAPSDYVCTALSAADQGHISQAPMSKDRSQTENMYALVSAISYGTARPFYGY